ncbi:MAG: sugar phosphate nucleotidyltransferase [Devosia sp.]|nr:sugar phosphate nucleotidyltransferase [Devosia sp.]
MKVVIQCGGKGMRLRPYTTVLPKPLLPVGSKPVLELLLRWLRRNGTTEVFITTGYLGHLIRTFCGDGRQWDLSIEYSQEPEPLGTIGALSLLRDRLDKRFLVINGDVLTDLNIASFIRNHQSSGTLLSVATMRRSVRLDFGVIEETNGRIHTFREKPNLSSLVSMGIYCFEPEMLKHIPSGTPFGFDDLVFRMLDLGAPVNTYLHDGFWLDVGRIEDFQKAQDLEWSEDAPAFDVTPAIFDQAAD